MQAELENVSAQVREGEGEGDAKSYKDEFAALQKRLGRLEKEERSLEEDMHIADLEPGQAQKQLLEKVKKMNAQTAELDGVAKDMKGSIAGQKKQLQELANELAERKGARGSRPPPPPSRARARAGVDDPTEALGSESTSHD